MFSLQRRIAGAIFPRYIHWLDQLNGNALIMKWFRDHRDLPVFENREAMYDFLQAEYLKDQPIDYLEFGVFEGWSMRQWVGRSAHADSRFFGFDSFEGLPEDWDRMGRGTFDVKGAVPKIDDPRVEFVKGWFQDTLPQFASRYTPRSRILLNNDSDLHSSTIYVLTKLDHVLAPGSIVILDEFGHPLHEFRAWHDYLAAYRRQAKPIAATHTPVRAAFLLL